MNTRTYPRTFAQAFPRSCEMACAIERPDLVARRQRRARDVSFGICMAVVVGLVLWLASAGYLFGGVPS